MLQKKSRPSRRLTHHPRRGTKGVKKGYNGSQYPQEGRLTIQEGSQEGAQRQSRRGTKGVKKGYNGCQDPQEGRHTFEERGHTIQERIWGKSRPLGKRTRHPKRGYKGSQEGVQEKSRPRGTKGVKKGYKGSQDLWEGGHTIKERVERESRRGTKGVKTLGKADTPSKKGVQRDSRRGTKGVKILGKTDTQFAVEDPSTANLEQSSMTLWW